MTNSPFRLLWIVVVCVCLRVSYQSYQFYINNLYQGSPKNGTMSYPFDSIDTAFTYLENNMDDFTQLDFIFTLIPTNTTYYWFDPSYGIGSSRIKLKLSGANQPLNQFSPDNWCESLVEMYIRADYEMTLYNTYGVNFEFISFVLQPGSNVVSQNSTLAAFISTSDEVSFNMCCFIGNSSAVQAGQPMIQLNISQATILSMTNIIFQNVSSAATFIISNSTFNLNTAILQGSQLLLGANTIPLFQFLGSLQLSLNINITNTILNFSTEDLLSYALPPLITIDQYQNISVMNFSLTNQQVQFTSPLFSISNCSQIYLQQFSFSDLNYTFSQISSAVYVQTSQAFIIGGIYFDNVYSNISNNQNFYQFTFFKVVQHQLNFDFSQNIFDIALTNSQLSDSLLISIDGNLTGLTVTNILMSNISDTFSFLDVKKIFMVNLLNTTEASTYIWNITSLALLNMNMTSLSLISLTYQEFQTLKVLEAPSHDEAYITNLTIANSTLGVSQNLDTYGESFNQIAVISSEGFGIYLLDVNVTQCQFFNVALFSAQQKIANFYLQNSTVTFTNFTQTTFIDLSFEKLTSMIKTDAMVVNTDYVAATETVLIDNTTLSNCLLQGDSVFLSTSWPFVVILDSSFVGNSYQDSALGQIGGLKLPVTVIMDPLNSPNESLKLQPNYAFQIVIANNEFVNESFSSNIYLNIEEFCMANSLVFLQNNTFNNLSALLTPGLEFALKFESVSTVVIDSNNFTSFQGSLYAIRLGEMKQTKVFVASNNQIASIRNSGFFFASYVFIQDATFSSNLFTDLEIDLNLIFTDQVLISGNFSFYSNTFSNITLNPSDLVSSIIEMDLSQVASDGSYLTASSDGSIMVENNFFTDLSIVKNLSYLARRENVVARFAASDSQVIIRNTTIQNSIQLFGGHFLSIYCPKALISYCNVMNITVDFNYGVFLIVAAQLTVEYSSFSNITARELVQGGVFTITPTESYTNLTTVTISSSTFSSITGYTGTLLWLVNANLIFSGLNNTYVNNSALTDALFYIDKTIIQSFSFSNSSIIPTTTTGAALIQIQECSGIASFANLTLSMLSTDLNAFFKIIQSINFTANFFNICGTTPGFQKVIYYKGLTPQISQSNSRILDEKIDLPMITENWSELEIGVPEVNQLGFVLADSGVINISAVSFSEVNLCGSPLISLTQIITGTNMSGAQISLSDSIFRSILYGAAPNDLSPLARIGSVLDISIPPQINNGVTILLVNCSFNAIFGNNSGVVTVVDASDNFNSRVVILSSNFTNLSAAFGAAVSVTSLMSKNMELLTIADSVFMNNSAIFFAGAIYLYQLNYTITRSSFIFNQAVYAGGAIWLFMSQDTSMLLENNNFTGNIAVQGFGNETATGPISLAITIENQNIDENNIYITTDANTNTTIIKNASSYVLESINFAAYLVDELGQAAKDPLANKTANLTVKIMSQDRSNPIVFVLRNCTDNGCFKTANTNDINVKIPGNENETVNITIAYSSYLYQAENAIQVQLRGCLPGEINLTMLDKTCEPCPVGKYSFNPQDEYCKICPKGGNCTGGSHIEPLANYWRNSVSSDIITPCVENRCLGGYNSACVQGYTGPLCLQCDLNASYVRDVTTSTCEQCSGPNESFIKALLTYLLSLVYQFFIIEKFFAANKNFVKAVILKQCALIPNISPWLNTLINYSQIGSSVLVFRSGLESYLIVLSTIGFQMEPLKTSLDCMLYHAGATGFQAVSLKVIWFMASPVIKFLLYGVYCLIEKIIRIIKRKNKSAYNQLWVKLVIAAVVLATMEHPDLLSILFSYTKCRQLDPNSTILYSMLDTSIECGRDDYLNFYYFFIIPMILVWGFAIPIGFFSLTYRNRHQLSTNINFRILCGSLVASYTDKYYFWGTGIMFFKMLLLIVTTLITDLKILALTLIVCFYGYLYAITNLKPYRQNALQKIMPLVIFSYMTTVFVTFYYKDNNYPLLKIVAAVILGIMNVSTIGSLVYHTSVIIKLQRRLHRENKELKEKRTKQITESPIIEDQSLDADAIAALHSYDDKLTDTQNRRISVDFRKRPSIELQDMEKVGGHTKPVLSPRNGKVSPEQH